MNLRWMGPDGIDRNLGYVQKDGQVWFNPIDRVMDLGLRPPGCVPSRRIPLSVLDRSEARPGHAYHLRFEGYLSDCKLPNALKRLSFDPRLLGHSKPLILGSHRNHPGRQLQHVHQRPATSDIWVYKVHLPALNGRGE